MPKPVPVSSDAAPTATGLPPLGAGLRPGAHPFGRLRGLDGLRAIAVLAVVIYHGAAGGLSGGFLGVEVFFVISGYLITALLLDEHRARGRIDLLAFWARRARRLLPAIFVLLGLVLAFAIVVLPEDIARLRMDALAAFAYVTNWHLIAGDQSYFESIGRPSLFVHLWSLAIEEQFYLVWPIVLGLLLVAGRRVALGVTLLGAVGSAVWMALQFDPASDPSRVYYGTDTRLTGLLLGAALAFVWVPTVPVLPSPATGLNRRKRRRLLVRARAATHWESRRLGWGLDVVGLAALAGLIGLFARADAFEPFVYQGGLALLGVTTVALIAVSVHPRTRIGRLLDVAPLRWMGTRSYSIYLWHWPIFAVTRPEVDLPLDPLAVLAVRLGLTALAAEASYRFVEMPVRNGSLGRAWRRRRSAEPAGPVRIRRWSMPAFAGGMAAVLSVLLVSVAMARPPAPPDGMLTASIDELVVDPATPTTDQPAASAPAVPSLTPPTTASPAASSAASSPASPRPTSTPSPSASATPRGGILAFGESVMIQGAKALAKDLGPVRVDAAVGRQIDDGIEILEKRAAAGKLAGTVIVQLGNNGPFRAGQFDAVMAALQEVPQVIWVNVRVPRDWEAHNNRIIEGGVERYENARLVDWYDATAGRPELFWKDGYHPRPEGADLYAELIAAAVE